MSETGPDTLNEADTDAMHLSWRQRARDRIASWSGRQRQLLALVIVVLLLLLGAAVIFLRLAFG